MIFIFKYDKVLRIKMMDVLEFSLQSQNMLTGIVTISYFSTEV